jgi:hypothetical protein
LDHNDTPTPSAPWYQSVPSSATPPAFEPRIYREPGCNEYYDDGRVFATVEQWTHPDTGKSCLTIFEWSSHYPGCGHTEEALSWLRSRFNQISAYGIGSIDEDGCKDISYQYWERMQDKGLVDVLVDDDGNELYGSCDGRHAPRRGL